MDAESLKEVGVTTIGQRLAILKAVYQLKLAQQIPIEPDDYVPPCESWQKYYLTFSTHVLQLRWRNDKKACLRNACMMSCAYQAIAVAVWELEAYTTMLEDAHKS